jgi:hypothetical protein
MGVPDAAEMTRMANARRAAEKVEMKHKKKTADRSYTLAVLKLMRVHWPLLGLGLLGASIAGAVCPPLPLPSYIPSSFCNSYSLLHVDFSSICLFIRS